MGYLIYDEISNEVVTDENQISFEFRVYEFDTGEEALYEIILSKKSLALHSNTLMQVTEILKPINVRGLEFPNVFLWRKKYVFKVLGNHCGFVGELKPKKQKKCDCSKPDLNLINWDRYSWEEKRDVFLSLSKAMGLDDESDDEPDDKVCMNTLADEIREQKQNLCMNTLADEICEQKQNLTQNEWGLTRNKEVSKELSKYVTPTKQYVVYLLYCDQTPNIYYIGQSGNFETRFKSHCSNTKGSCSKPKYEWVKYINDNNWALQYKILEKKDKQHVIHDRERYWIDKYIEDQDNVVLNFTTKKYQTNSLDFLQRYQNALGISIMDKRGNINIIAISSTAVLNHVCITHAFATTPIKNIIKHHSNPSNATTRKKGDWARNVRDLDGVVDIEYLDACDDMSEVGELMEKHVINYLKRDVVLVNNHYLIPDGN